MSSATLSDQRNLLNALRTVFPSFPEERFTPALKLSECPNWDSMTAVNLMMEIETACQVKLGAYEPSDHTTLADVAQVIRSGGGQP